MMWTSSELQDDQVYVYQSIKFNKMPYKLPYLTAWTSLILLYIIWLSFYQMPMGKMVIRLGNKLH